MKILVIHNYHKKFSPSGDDLVVNREVDLLKRRGHEVLVYSRSNDEIYQSNFWKLPYYLVETIWSLRSYKDIRELILKKKPDIAHIHNFFPLLNAGSYKALLEENIRIVQSLHDYRFFCINAFLHRDGKICEDCIQHGMIVGVKRKCYKGSFFLSFMAYMNVRLIDNLKLFDKIDAFIVFTKHGKEKFSQLGISPNKIFVKPHFLPQVNHPSAPRRSCPGDYFLFLGRLSEEKGINVLISAWKDLNLPLKIVGDGPLVQRLKNRVDVNIKIIGYIKPEDLRSVFTNAYATIVPSVFPETFGLVTIESFREGVPVIASKIGALQHIVKNGYTGLLFKPGDVKDLMEKVRYLWEHKDTACVMGENAKKEFMKKYTEDVNYRILMDIYNHVIKRS